MENEELKFDEKNEHLFECKHCYYSCSYLSDWNRHLSTVKHKKHKMELKMENEELILAEKYNTNYFVCEKCNIEYKTQSGLWKHNKKCSQKIVTNTELVNKKLSGADLSLNKEVILMLLKENTELKNLMIKEQTDFKGMMMKMMETVTLNSINNNSNNNNNTNSHNKTFNLQFFLNETCKDAMNISEFIENIKIDVSDLENMGRVGYVEGMSNILVKNLNTLDVTRRPIHCTDKKREIMYIKDNNVWEKDDEQRNKLHKTIKRVSHKNIKILPAYREKYPGCEFAVSRFSDNYNKMIIEVMGGPGDDDFEKEDKIIQKIAKYVTINKGGE